MTNDLISREALLPEVDFDANHCHYCRVTKDAIANAPAIDAAPVVHARWYQCKLNVPKGKGQTYLVWGCSNCHKHERKRSDYCPHCGAKMDLEKDDA